MLLADVLKEVSAILGERHAAFRLGSDRIRNAETFCYRIGRDSPSEASVLVAAIRNDLDAASTISDLHPDRCAWIANRIEEGIKQQGGA